jgi:intein-encoded DNA endonuclease-like protein
VKNNLTEEELEIIKENYGKISVKEIKNLYLSHLKLSTIYYEAGKLNLSNKRIIYNFKWSPEMAYFVGWTAADGNLYHKDNSYMIRININEDDGYILHKMQKAIKAGKVRIINRKSYGKKYKQAFWGIYDKSLYEKLIKIGLTPNKSLTLQWPNIPQEYYRDFIRGFFDGDGSISFNKAPDYKGAWRAVFYCASKDFIYKLKEVLKDEVGINSQNLNKYTSCYAYKFGRLDTIKLGKWMYYDDCLKLDRKYEKFQKAFKEQEKCEARQTQRSKDLDILKQYYGKISAKELRQKYLPHLSLANIYKLGRQIPT